MRGRMDGARNCPDFQQLAGEILALVSKPAQRLGLQRSINDDGPCIRRRRSGAGLNDVILQTEGLTKEFRGFTAVREVDLAVRRGPIHALIGPNGAGKTTVFNLLTRFLPPTAGRIVYEGVDITSQRAAQVARSGMVRSFQVSAVFGNLTVLENVRVALQRSLGTSFHFWRSEKTLAALDERAR